MMTITSVNQITRTKFLHIPSDLLQDLKFIALERGTTESEATIEAISNFVAKHKRLIKEVSLK
ncbi:MAG: hypothetical protein WAK17_11310 [Candidatus Nitrosopolaris sp.]|jgi:hypothetical protein